MDQVTVSATCARATQRVDTIEKPRWRLHGVLRKPRSAISRSGVETMKRPRGLSDKILVAFHSACDDDDPEVAATLLLVLEGIVRRSRTNNLAERRSEKDVLVAAHERLWALRHRFDQRG